MPVSTLLYMYMCLNFAEWNKHPGEYCTMFWEGWDKELNQKKLKQKYKINDISTYVRSTNGQQICIFKYML